MHKHVRRVLIAAAALILVGGGILGYKKMSDLYWRLYHAVQVRADCTDELITENAKSAGSTPYPFNYGWAESSAVPPLIAHALGGIDGKTYTNSREAFVSNYEKGFRVFEVDFSFPNDDYHMIAMHGEEHWNSLFDVPEGTPFTLANFLGSSQKGGLTPMDYRDVVDLLAKYPDAYIVTDSKYTDKARVLLEFTQLVQYAMDTAPQVLNRIIPQIYHQQMLEWIMDVYPFRSVIFTLYMIQWNADYVYKFCEQSGVRFITLWADLITPEYLEKWGELGIHTAVHTVNDPQEAKKYLDMGVDMVYTDFVTPDSL